MALGVAAMLALYYFAERDRGPGTAPSSTARVASLAENAPQAADAGLGARLGPFPAEKLRSGKSRWGLAIEHSGAELTTKDIRAAAAAAELESVPIEREGKPRDGVLRFGNVSPSEFEPPGERELQYRGRGLDAADLKRAAALQRATWIGRIGGESGHHTQFAVPTRKVVHEEAAR
jgi:hypothetical protein